MKNTNLAVVWDLDGTLADNSQRRHLAPGDPQWTAGDAPWDEWALACGDDMPIMGSVVRMRMDYAYYQVHICSSRGAIAYEQTRDWLGRTAGKCYDYLTLRTRGDCRPGKVLKAEYILGLQADGLTVMLAYEDIKEDADYITEMTGVQVMLVNPAYEWIEVLRDSSGTG